MTEGTGQDQAAGRKERRIRRLHQVLVELDREPEGLEWGELWRRLIEAIPLTEDDLAENKSGTLRGETDTRFQRQYLDKAGWVLTGVGRMRITQSGRAALHSYRDPVSLFSAAERAYREWDQLRAVPASTADASISTGIVPPDASDTVVLSAARSILDRGLWQAGSAFDEHRHIWQAGTINKLRDAFLGHLDDSGDTFIVKFRRQLHGAPDDVILLAAEMIALLLLPLHDWKPETKRRRVKEILALMAEPVHMPAAISAAMDHGVYTGGVAFKTLFWKALATLIEVATAWQALDAEGRVRARKDPWAWKALVSSAGGASIESARSELLYLGHPETFLPIISADHKRSIRDAFLSEIGSSAGDVDRYLFQITLALQHKSDAPVPYYEEPFVSRWRREPDPSPSQRAWLVRGSSVRGVDMIPTWLEEGFVSLPASQLAPLELPAEPAEIRAAVDEGYAQVSYLKREEKVREVRAFLLTMKPDDLVMTTSNGIIHVGTITAEPEQVASDGSRSNLRRAVEWADVAIPFEELPAELSALLKSGGDVTDLTDVVDLVSAFLPQVVYEEGEGDGVETLESKTPPKPVELRHLTVEEADALLVGAEWLNELVDLLNLRRQVILYGPPGTGKTYLALKTAEAIAQPENVRMVQFHPAYSYEDFFEGYRPRRGEGGVVGFELKAGPFRRIVEDAREHPDQPYVLIIDEINRANLAKVFGELYFLLEYRDNAIELLNSEEDSKPFSLPKNVYIVGTMNTADRSIALVDAAMRRRFAFLSLHPDDAHVHGILRAWLERREMDLSPADILDELNSRIPDADFKIGPAYLMKPGEVDSDTGLERIWRTSILPQLEELHYGDTVDVRKRYGLESLRKALPAAASAEEGSPAKNERRLLEAIERLESGRGERHELLPDDA